MVDTVDVKRRSEIMSKIRAKDMKPEMVVRRLTFAMGYRYRLHRRDLPGTPDLVFPGRKKVIFVHGCFWHQHDSETCRIARIPKSNVDYWLPKLERNVARDAENLTQLAAMGWKALIIWECETSDPDLVRSKIRNFLEEGVSG